MKNFFTIILVALLAEFVGTAGYAQVPAPLRVGRAGHAFDHVGPINEQAEAAVASGATIIYASGLGGFGYEGLPAGAEFAKQREAVTQYSSKAKRLGVELSIGYLCATSIVGLEDFDDAWSDGFRRHFKTPPHQWLQQDWQGAPLPSWYGGQYHPACVNHPDWRAYEKFMVRQQLETGHDGIFFDNPTVHPQGCYCEHCMKKFAAYLREHGTEASQNANVLGKSTGELRELAAADPRAFMQFRTTIARDFLTEMREFARTINPQALVTCNNSLNSPDRMYAQCRVHGYNINELSKAEDFVVVEDMVSQPRVDADGQAVEYGPTYKQLHAISHGKPIVAVTLVRDDYHTAPHLVRLAMAEAAAHGASYLCWPTWPEEQRERMAAAIRPQARLLRENEELLNDAPARDDVVLFLPFRRWVESDSCRASALAAALTAANLQYRVISEDDFAIQRDGGRPPIFLAESRSVLNAEEARRLAEFEQFGGRVIVAEDAEWLAKVQAALTRPSVEVTGPATIRAVVRDQPNRTIVHLYNLHIERLSSFEDRVTPATDVKLTVRAPMKSVGEVNLRAADESGTSGPVAFVTRSVGGDVLVDLDVPRVEISAIIVITP